MSSASRITRRNEQDQTTRSAGARRALRGAIYGVEPLEGRTLLVATNCGAKAVAFAALVLSLLSVCACPALADLPPGFPNPITFWAALDGPEGRVERAVELLHAPDGGGGMVHGYFGENATAGGSLFVNGWAPFAGEFSGWLFDGVAPVPWGVVGHVDAGLETFVIESWSGAGVVLVVPEPTSAGAVLGVLVAGHAVLPRRRRQERAPRRADRGVEPLERRMLLAASLVKDINTVDFGSSPVGVDVGGTYFFTANDFVHGTELWKSDGTNAGTAMVAELTLGPAGSNITNLTSFGGALYFTFDDGVTGGELWTSDGTEAGTRLAVDLMPGPDASDPANLTAVGSALYFSAFAGFSTGRELFTTDGTAAGTVLVKDIYPGADSSDPADLANVNGMLYFFTSNNLGSNLELWKSDGTEAGTTLIKDISPGVISNPTTVGSTLFFTTDDGTSGLELWKSDGTDTGTMLVKDIVPGSGTSHPSLLTDVNGTLFFSAFQPGVHTELWKSDGTDAGTVLVKDIRPGSLPSFLTLLTNVNGTLFFQANDGTGSKLWKSDGTAAGTVSVGGSSPNKLTSVGGTLYFTSSAGGLGEELWKSDGTPAGTVLVRDMNPGSASSSPSNLSSVGGSLLYFAATDGLHGAELWRSDGTAAGTFMVRNINTVTDSGASTGDLVDVNGVLFFSANDGINGSELWKSDGTTAGTLMVKDIFSGGSGSSPDNLRSFNGALYFSASTSASGAELWRSDGTDAGTFLVKDVRPGSNSSQTRELTVVGDTLYFRANNGTNGQELWKSDGTSAGTVMVKDIIVGSGSSNAQNLANVDGTLFFSANDGTSGTELWRSDGTAAGTVRVKDIAAGTGSSAPELLTAVGGTVFFRTAANQVWKSDGTDAGTTLLAGFGPTPLNFLDVGGTLYFSVAASLWKSDGTVAGTVQVSTVPIVSGPFASVGDTLFFVGSDNSTGTELWKTDGTEAGTVLVKDIRPGFTGQFANSSSPRALTNIAGTLYFFANDGISGFELWSSDGTEAGTAIAADINPGSADSLPFGNTKMTYVGGTIYFAARHELYGTELWKFVHEEVRSSLSGLVWLDINNTGQVDLGEDGIAGVTINLTGTDDLGQSVSRSLVTDGDGVFVFADLRPGTYALAQVQPAEFVDGREALGTLGGVVAPDAFSAIVLGADAHGQNYNFGERPIGGGTVSPGMTAGIGFWQNRNGQDLIQSLNGGPTATNLSAWLAATMPGVYGAGAADNSLLGFTNAQVAAEYQEKFRAHGGPKLDAQVMAAALAVYVTTQSLGGSAGASYGFLVSAGGLGNVAYNVGSHGVAFGAADGTSARVIDLLLAVNAQAVGGVLYGGDVSLRQHASAIFDDINSDGGI